MAGGEDITDGLAGMYEEWKSKQAKRDKRRLTSRATAKHVPAYHISMPSHLPTPPAYIYVSK